MTETVDSVSVSERMLETKEQILETMDTLIFQNDTTCNGKS